MALNAEAVAWASALGTVTTYVGYQAGSLKSRILAERDYHDPETGLVTRKGFEHGALKFLRRAVVGRRVVMMDLNDLKKVNDEFGHAAGDIFIREQAGRLGDWARMNGGLAARLGGDEFVAIVGPSANFMDLKESLARPIAWDDKVRYWGAAVGEATVSVSLTNDGRKDDLSKALRLADQRMYEDKGGKSRGRR